MRKTFFYLALIAVCLCRPVTAQYDFNDYRTLQAKGTIPPDFLQDTYQKIEQRMETDSALTIKNDIDQRVFLSRSMYPIDELLHSGYVVYGDEISTHVRRIADLLLKDQPELAQQLRFYTLKSDETNAFSTDQGIIFVTTGLIGQLENDAQLAYVLAHEIAHYTEKHVVNTYTWSRRANKGTDWVTNMSKYSRENELDADRLAIDLYRKAGFAKEELEGTFDVLLYSYLPFDEIPVPLAYFKSDSMYVPETLFPSQDYPIRAKEDIKDSQSTHPNIAKRKAALAEGIAALDGSWGTMTYLGDEAAFTEVRTIARFECLRVQVMNAEFGKALYSIFLLEQEYPHSIYLQRLKGQCWLGLLQYTISGKRSHTFTKSSQLEGESAAVHYLLGKLDKKEQRVFSLRKVYDLHKAFPEDEELTAIYKQVCRELGNDAGFKPADYATISYEKAVQKAESQPKDTVVTSAPSNKYDRIKKTSNPVLADRPDSTNYYVYGLHDIVQDEEFLKLFREARATYEQTQKEEEAWKALSKAEQKKYRKKHGHDHLKVNVRDMIVVEPRVVSFTKSGVDNERSEQLENLFQESYTIAAETAGSKISIVSGRQFETGGTELFNRRNALQALLQQMTGNENVQSFPVDFTLTRELVSGYGTSKVLYSVVEHTFDPEFSNGLLITSLLFPVSAPVILPLHVPAKIISGSHTQITLVLLDAETGEVTSYDSSYLNVPLNKHNLAAHLYLVFNYFGSEPTKVLNDEQ